MPGPTKLAGAPVGPLPFGGGEAVPDTGAGAAAGDRLAPRHPQGVLDLVPQPSQTFDNFIVGDNAELVELLRGGMQTVPARFFYLWGPPGCGRSHLLHAATGAGSGSGAARAGPAAGGMLGGR